MAGSYCQHRHDLPIALLASCAMCAVVEDTVVIYVDDDAVPGGDGTSWTSAHRFLQDALPGALFPPGGIELRLAGGVYLPDESEAAPDGTGARAATFTVFSLGQFAIRGGYAGVGAADPDYRDIKKFPTVLSGDLNGDDGPELEGTEENSLHVVTTLVNIGIPVILDGLVIEAGNANIASIPDRRGGGVLNLGAALEVSQCTVRRNWAVEGAGIYSDQGTLVATDCVFSLNNSEINGSILFDFEGSVQVKNSVVTENGLHSAAGGMFSIGGDVAITNCTFTGNRVLQGMLDLHGGARGFVDANTFVDQLGPIVMALQSDLTVQGCHVENVPFVSLDFTAAEHPVTCSVHDCTFQESGHVSIKTNVPTWTERCEFVNMESFEGGGLQIAGEQQAVNRCSFLGCRAEFGGAVHAYGIASPTFSNCLFADNDAFEAGASIFVSDGASPHLINCTFTGPVVERDMRVIHLIEKSAAVLANCIIWHHAPLAAPGTDVTVSHSVVEGGWPGVGNISVDPQFVDPTRDDYGLAAGSPCIDAGSNPAVARGVTEDLDGNPRFQDDPATMDTGLGLAPIVDMGAFEFQPSLDPADLDQDGDVDGFDLALLLGAWGGCPSKGSCSADLDGNGVVNGFDLAMLLAMWTAGT